MSEDSVIENIGPPSERQIGAVDQSFYLIGVGASAGGLDAIKQMISQIPSSFPHSLVIVQHISPDYKSLMSEILGRETSLPVIEVTDNLAVEAGHIYLIPPRSNIVIQGTKADSGSRLESGPTAAHHGLRFSLIGQTPRPGLNLPIDVFFHSLAEAVKDRAIAVVLSGSGSDGSRGLRAIKDREGFVLVQDPEVSAFDGMPRSSIATGIVDLVLNPDAIVGEINRYLEMRERGIDSVERVFSKVGDEFSELLTLVSERAEIDFSLYKEPTLQRRIARRMALRGYSTLTEYLAHLRREPAELNVLYREFLVGVTNFFRDLPVWQNLEDTILPTLFKEGEQSEPVRIWSAGCSTGEEAYTIAMLMERFREENGLMREFRIFATDVNEASIQTAKQGIYPDNVREEIPDAFLKKGYLTFQSGTFTVASHIRNRIVFAEHNVTEDAPYTRTDLIVCRNMLIYLSPDVQAKIMTHFSFSLRKNGFLQLGAAETPGQHGAMFEAVAHKARIYRNTRQRDSMARRANQSADFPVAQFLPRSRRMPDRKNPLSSDINVLLNMTLEDGDACVCIVDDNSKVVRTFGQHSNLLHIPSAGFSANLLELVDDRLRSSVALVLRRAEIEGRAEKRSVRLVDEDDIEIVDVLCRKISWEAQAVAFAVTFRTRRETVEPNAAERVLPEAPNIPTQAYIQHLEGEVQSLQDMLSATAEDLGASNEELQTTNEELIASNEELQANNEETQSINEELHTLNAENADKIAQLEAATGDINNLLATADLGVLVLDDELCIRQFSAGLNRYVYLEAGDVGRPFENFAMTLEAEGVVKLMDDARMSRSTAEESSRELRGRDGGFAFCRVRPYRNVHGEHRGVVITLQDITDQKLLEREVRSQRDRLEGLLESEAAGYWDWDVEEDALYMSPRFKSMFGYQDDEVPNTPRARLGLIHPEDIAKHEKALAAHVSSEGAELYDLELRHLHKDGSIVWVLSRGRVVEWNDARQPKRMMGVHVDVSALKEREEEVQQRAEEVRRFAFIAAHDLIQPMNTIDSCIAMLCEDLPIGDDPEQAEVVGFLTSSTARMKARINGVLDYARLMDQEVSPELIPLKPVVKDTLTDLKSQIDAADAEIVVENLPEALGAASLISRVFQNLISNSLKYRRSDRPCRIEIDSVPAPSGMVKIRVTDNGIGIDPKHRRKVFELFARLHTEDQIPGRGMGLSLCERIVARLGGTMAVEDGQDGGSAFTFTLRSE